MAEQMTSEDVDLQEKINTGTTWTRNDFMEKHGYLVIRNLWDPEELKSPVPTQRGQYNFHGNDTENYEFIPVENQVEGSTSRYWYPQYRQIHSEIRHKIEKEIGRTLYETYYYDRFYFSGQKLEKHADRDACEISVTVHIDTNLQGDDADWPIWIKTPDQYSDETHKEISVKGENHFVILKPGDGMVYKGCERPHWRDIMPGKVQPAHIIFPRHTYYHQIFFHYVLQDGYRAHFAWDRR